MFWTIAGIGAGVGVASKYYEGKKQRDALKDQRWLNERAFRLGQAHSDKMFNLSKNEALGNLDIQRRNLNKQMGMAVEDFNTGLMAQAFGIQDARIDNSSGVGAHQVMEGASGTRGNATGEMVRNYATQGLERNIQIQERQNTNQLNQLVTGANIAAEGIQRERDSWDKGGFRYEEKQLNDAYNKDIHKLSTEDINRKISQANPGWLDFTVAGISGASSLIGFAKSASEYYKHVDDWKERVEKARAATARAQEVGNDISDQVQTNFRNAVNNSENRFISINWNNLFKSNAHTNFDYLRRGRW